MRKKQNWVLLLVGLMTVGSVLLAACGNEEEPIGNGDENHEEEIETAEIKLYFLEDKDDEFQVADEQREVENPTPKKAVELLLAGPESDDLQPIIYEDTELLGLEIEDGIAYVDFNEALAKGAYGSEVEMRLIESIVYTLIQFQEVDKVQFKIEGEIPETIAGHVYTGEPLGEDF